MIREAIDRILSLDKPTIYPGAKFPDGLVRSDKLLQVITEPAANSVSTFTLQGFVDLISAGLDGLKKAEALAEIVSHTQVHLIARRADKYGRRHLWINADCKEDTGTFKFNQFMSAEQFVIGLQSCFVLGTPDLDYVLKASSSLAAEAVTTSTDDGVSQTAAFRGGVVLKNTETVKARVRLAPYRTFREVTQPHSDFIFRLKSGGEGQLPACALFEADGGRWKLDAVLEIQKWLENHCDDLGVIA